MKWLPITEAKHDGTQYLLAEKSTMGPRHPQFGRYCLWVGQYNQTYTKWEDVSGCRTLFPYLFAELEGPTE